MQAAKQFDYYALMAVQRLARKAQTFTSDDVMAVLPRVLPPVKDKRRLGAVMLRAMRKGWIMRSEQFTPSTNKRHHSAPSRVWHSLIFRARVERMDDLPLFTGKAESCAPTI